MFNILLLDFTFPRWSVNSAFSTSFFTVLLRAGARRPHFSQRFFYNISCYLSTKSSNLRYLHQRQILSESPSSTVLLPLLLLLTILWLLHHWLLDWCECSFLVRTSCHRWGGREEGGSRRQLARCLPIIGPTEHSDGQAEQKATWVGWALRSRDSQHPRGIRGCSVRMPHFSDKEVEI